MKISEPGCGVNLANILPLYTVCSCSRENGVRTDFSGFTGGDGFSGFFMQKDNIEINHDDNDKVAVAKAGQDDGEMQALENLLRCNCWSIFWLCQFV